MKAYVSLGGYQLIRGSRHPEQTDYAAVGNAGGAKEVTLGLNYMPPHNHTGGTNQARFAYLDNEFTLNSDTDSSPTEPNLAKTAAIQTEGGGQPFDNRPPYYVLAAREWVGF